MIIMTPSLIMIIRTSVAIDAICTFAGDGNGEVTGEVQKKQAISNI